MAAVLEGIYGYKFIPQNRPYLKIIIGLVFVAFITAFYILGDITSSSYEAIIRRFENLDTSEITSSFEYLNNSVEKYTKVDGYVVWSPSCRIPDIPPFHESVKSFYEKQSITKCSDLPLLTTVIRNGSSHVLLLHKDHFKKYSKVPLKCCYSLITRKDMAENSTSILKADEVYRFGKCIPFKDKVTFSKEEEFLKVQCTYKKVKATINAYVNFHAFVSNRNSLTGKITKIKNSPNKKMGVMIIGIDSISRLNLIRTMPKTWKYLEDQGWFTLKGYNKMDDNTFPNLMAILTGYSVSQLRKYCWNNPKQKLDNCPIIWKNFSQNGYITAYGEDEPTISSFNYHKTGFLKTPTDYYLRPFMLAAVKTMKIKLHAGLDICLGPMLNADHILNYILDFSQQFNSTATFSLFWMNCFSHNDLNTPTTMDDNMVKFFKNLVQTGVMSSTLIIFISDHGIRFGKIRQTYVGYLEERLPFIYFWLPDYFKKENPQKVKNLLTNEYRLTSPYDLHLTLADILGNKRNGTNGCPNCLSLFDEVPWNRNCSFAGITNHWCTCSEYKTLPVESNPVRAIVRFVVNEINQINANSTQHLTNGTRCAELKAKKVISIRSKIFSHSTEYSEYVILIETYPGGGMFEATVSHKNTFKIMDTISRINTYSRQSSCMNDSYAKKYCYCKHA